MKEDLNIVPLYIYNDIESNKISIYRDNKDKAGVYRWTNKINNKSYIGSSANLYTRIRTYLCIKTISKASSYIYSSIIKHGYSCFTLEIIEHCDKNVVLEREQYYIDNLNPEYNILKVAGSKLGHKMTFETKKAISVSSRNRAKCFPYAVRTKIIENTTPKVFDSNTIKKLSLRNQGVNVKILDKNGNLIGEFPTMRDAAKYLNLCVTTISRVFDTGISYDDYIYEFKLKDSRILIYNENNELVDIVENTVKVSDKYNIPRSTLSGYINKNKLYKNKYYFYNKNFIESVKAAIS